MILHMAVMLFGVLISSFSQILLKKSAQSEHKSFLSEYLNVRVITAYFILFVSSLLSIVAYRVIPLSMGPVLESTGYIYVAVLGALILKERMNRKKIIGIMLIVVGVLLYTFFG